MKSAICASALLATLTACSQRGDEERAQDPVTSPAAAPDTPAPEPQTTVGIPEGGIPVTLQGSWGMVPGDCSSTHGDAKGLLNVSATTLTFYESVGTLGTIAARSDTRIEARFSFTGEGMTWQRSETLEVKSGGETLVRTASGEGGGGPFTYTRCEKTGD